MRTFLQYMLAAALGALGLFVVQCFVSNNYAPTRPFISFAEGEKLVDRQPFGYTTQKKESDGSVVDNHYYLESPDQVMRVKRTPAGLEYRTFYEKSKSKEVFVTNLATHTLLYSEEDRGDGSPTTRIYTKYDKYKNVIEYVRYVLNGTKWVYKDTIYPHHYDGDIYKSKARY